MAPLRTPPLAPEAPQGDPEPSDRELIERFIAEALARVLDVDNCSADGILAREGR